MHLHRCSALGVAQRTGCATQLTRAQLRNRPWLHRRGLRCCAGAADSVLRTMSDNGEVSGLVVDGNAACSGGKLVIRVLDGLHFKP